LYTSTAYDATGAPVRQTAAMKSGLWLPTPIPRQPSSSVTYSYTSLGQPETINYGVGNKVSYDYNLRGQVREIVSNGFTQKLWYEDGGTHPCYNGNISRMQVSGVTSDYTYDTLNRLTACTSTDGYNTVYEYDQNSSPTKIERYGMTSDGSVGLVDDMKMSYDGNRLVKVTDAADPVILEQSLDFPKSSASLGYDSEGRLYSDSGRDIEKITYAPNDMPMTVFGPYGRIKTQYAYAADGRKLSVAYGHNYTSSITDTRYYVGPIEFVKSSGKDARLTVDRVNLPWGFFAADGWDNVNLTDYQGNIRAIARSGSVIDHIDYYPYGLPKASAPGSVSRYKYSGKEFETRGGLDFYDFDARLQLPAAGLFSRPDPKAWDAPWNNTYLYCSANPINRIDPTGEYDFVNIKESKQYKVIAVFQSDYKNIDKKNNNSALTTDYKAAKKAGLPIMLVDNKADFKAAMKALDDMKSSTEEYTINSHGSSGYFYIGSDKIDAGSDTSSLKDGLSGKTVFIGACNSAVDLNGNALLETFSEDTGSNVIGSCHKIKAGYSYDGSDGLNRPSADGSDKGNGYKMSVSGADAVSIWNVTIDKSQGTKWNGPTISPPVITKPNLEEVRKPNTNFIR
ncbi:MAG: hypothetical protein K2I64_04515, partial [Muribaculaceae bacterium]|nr:hypothetical protein [Muribaculaceae bacterium]